jgi:arginine decarboxylase
LELPEFREGQDYFLGIFLVGAYQEVMGNHHNLFGIPNEAQVIVDDHQEFRVTRVVEGSTIRDMVIFARYEPECLVAQFRDALEGQIAAGNLDPSTAKRLVDEYELAAKWSTYLE